MVSILILSSLGIIVNNQIILKKDYLLENEVSFTINSNFTKIYNKIDNDDVKLSSTYNPPKYNRYAAYGYAYKWWNGYNPHYNDYSASGGDCANFVSQCLIAGGLSLHNGTDGTGYGVYPDQDRTSSDSKGTIPYCDYLDQHLRKYQDTNVYYTTEPSLTIPAEITIGDVVIFGNATNDKYKHAMIVVWRNSTELGLAAHSFNVWNKTFTQVISSLSFDCATFYHINDGKAKLYHFKVNTAGLNVRVGPGYNNVSNLYSKIGVIHDGEEYIAFGREKDEQGRWWWHFWFDDRAAWCAAWYTVNTSGNMIVEVDVGSYLNVRDGPRISYSIYGQVYNGMRFVSDTINGSWYRFWYGGAQKYSHGNYLNVLKLQNVSNTFIKPVMAFLPYWVSGDQNYSIVSHLAWFSVELNADGTIADRNGWPDWDVINAVHEAGNKIILTATLFDDSDISTLLASYKTATANNLLAEVQAGNADGICIDFELPQSGDGENLVAFMNILYTTFKNARNDYHISLCTPSVDWRNTFDYGSLDPYVDAFFLMGYGYYWSGSSKAGPTDPLEGSTYNLNWSVNDHLSKGASKDKLILGLPFYGYDYPVVDTSKQANTRGSGSSRTYSSALNLISTYGATVYYDDTYENAWFNYYLSGDGWRQVWFDNYTSYVRKFNYILNRDLGGLGIWAWGYQGSHKELEDLIKEKFIKQDLHPPGAFNLTTTADNPDIDGKFYLNWTQSTGADNYSVYYSTTKINSAGAGKLLYSGLTENYTLISNMMSGTYYFAVVAHNESGDTLSNNVFINVSLPLDLNSNAGNPDRDGDFDLFWDVVASADNYTLYSYNHPISEINGSLIIVQEGLKTNSYSITNIANNTILYYIVVAKNKFGNFSSNYIKISVIYGPPGEFTATCTADDPDDDGEFYITWTIPDGGIKYSIYRSSKKIYQINASWTPIIIDTITPNQYISGLKSGTHYIIVVAFNDYGNSSSNILEVNVKLPSEASTGGNEREKNEFDINEFILSPLGLAILSIGGGAIFSVILIKALKNRAYKASMKEREKLSEVSKNIKLAQKYKNKNENN
ncbi:MAG: glycosyl hydrolase family 18 protein [Promethearchaeia archaeon]